MVGVMLLSLAACRNTKNTENTGSQDSANSNKQAENKTEKNETKKELTLDDAQVRLVYEDEGYLLLAYYGPQDDIGMSFFSTDGSELSGNTITPYYWEFDNGWRLLETKELPDDRDSNSVGLKVTDYSEESEATKQFLDFGEPMTEEELKEIGVPFLNGYMCSATSYGSTGSSDVTITIEFIWRGKYHNTRLETWPFTQEDFTFFSSDGTPLEEAFEGFYLEEIDTRDVGGGQLQLVFLSEKDCSNEDFEALVALEPYMIFTGSDGSTQRIELLESYRK